jgi:hypothetical protein
MRDGGAQALALQTPSAQARHVCRRPGFVEKYEALRFEIKLTFEKLSDIGTWDEQSGLRCSPQWFLRLKAWRPSTAFVHG